MRILVVEDQRKLAEHLKVSLETEMFAVDIAEDGKRGLYLARTNTYDVIILDNLLPEKTGSEVCAELRASGRKTPIIILSVKSEANTKAELLNAGADDYLSKPFVLEELLARIRALLRRPELALSEKFVLSDLVLDSRAHRVSRQGKEIYLTRKEFMLLEYLIRNQGNVLSRGQILEHVWDMNADPFSNTIESHVVSLRRKLEIPGTPKLIHTVPGRGYKVDFA